MNNDTDKPSQYSPHSDISFYNQWKQYVYYCNISCNTEKMEYLMGLMIKFTSSYGWVSEGATPLEIKKYRQKLVQRYIVKLAEYEG